MNEMMQDECCLESQTQGCCEGGRFTRPFASRKTGKPTVLHVTEFSQEHVDEIKAIAEGTCDPHEAFISGLLKDRGSAYGPPEVNLDSTASMWDAYLRNRNPGPLTIHDVCYMNCLQKISRLARTPTHKDSQSDILGYTKIAENAG